jgi:hypothetical protein
VSASLNCFISCLLACGEICGSRVIVGFLFSFLPRNFNFACQIDRGNRYDEKRENVGHEGAGLTIQCELFGNPDTAAGPKARAVFMAAPVKGTANLTNVRGVRN